jgi:hypothetical protein
MCTLIIGNGVLAPGTVLLGANRDERPDRATDPPGVLRATPHVVGGRDAEAGGTWLAVRDGRAAIAILNRRGDPGAPAAGLPRRSRGLLALDVAAAPADFDLALDPAGEPHQLLRLIGDVSGPGLAHAALSRAFAALGESDYAPFSLVYAAPEATWLLAFGADRVPRVRAIPTGWHVLTHAELDDKTEPRTARLLRDLATFQPRSLEEALQKTGDLLRSHGTARGVAHPDRVPPVCLHEGPMRTVSSSLVFLAPDRARYLHASGRPCEHPYQDLSHLLETPVTRSGS